MTFSNMLVVLKLGGSVITDKKVENSFREETVARLGEEIVAAGASGKFKLIVVHGGGAYGHISAKKYGLGTSEVSDSDEGAEKTNQEMDRLVSLVVGKLKDSGLGAVGIRPKTVVGPKGIVSMETGEIKELLISGSVPVIGGFVAEDMSGGWRILSGDTIVPHLAKEFKADLVIVGSDVDGICSGDPSVNKDAKLIPEISYKNVDGFNIGGSAGVDVSGGMKKKVDELLELTKHGTSSRIINLNRVGILKDALGGKEVVGTKIVP
jgi:isopentenyl phosphate kinase